MAHSWCLISNCEEHQGLILLSTYYLNLYWSLFPFPIVLIPRYFLSCCWSYTSLSVQFSSVQLCPTICDPMNHSTPGLPVHHQHPESTQTQIHCVGDAIQPSCPLLSPHLPPSIFSSIRVFSNESALCIRWPKYWSFSFNIVPPMNTQDLSPLGWTGWMALKSKGLSRVFSNTIVQKHQLFGAQPSSQSNSHIHTWPQEKP